MPAPLSPVSPDQRRIVAAGLFKSGSCVLGLPTGAGKTRLAVEYIRSRHGTSLYLAPTKALAQSVWREWQKQFPDRTVRIFDGDHPGTLQELESADILVMTPERLDLCLRRPIMHRRWLSRLGLCVVDEIHNLGSSRSDDDGRRAACLEGVLLCLQSVNPLISILGLSATLSNQFDIAQWLEGTYYRSLQRPVKLHWETLVYRDPRSEKLRLLINRVRNIVADGYQVLVFCQSRTRCQDLATALQGAGIKADYHHAGRVDSERLAVELLYKAQDIMVLCTTSTLSQGIGGPHNVILYDLTRGRERSALGLDEVQQMAGRCGRIGDTGGVVTLMTHHNEQSLAQRYMTTEPQPVISRLAQPGQLAERVLVAVDGGYATTLEQAERFFNRSLAAYQGLSLDLTGVITKLIRDEVLEQDRDGTLSSTPLGSIAAQTMVSAIAVKQLVACQQPGYTYFDYLLVLCLLADFQPLRVSRDLTTLNHLLTQESSLLLLQLTQSSQSVLQRCPTLKRAEISDRVSTALTVRLWTRWGNYETVAQQLGYGYPQEVQKVVEECQRLLLVLETVSTEFPLADEAELSQSTQITALGYMLTLGVDETLLGLMQLEGVGPKKARLLQQAGINDLEALVALDELPIIPGIAASFLVQTVQQARSLAAPMDYREPVVAAHGYRLQRSDR